MMNEDGRGLMEITQRTMTTIRNIDLESHHFQQITVSYQADIRNEKNTIYNHAS
jgi:hypothetical protein